MRLPDPSPVLDKNRAPMGPEILSSTGAVAIPDSSSVLDKFQSEACFTGLPSRGCQFYWAQKEARNINIWVGWCPGQTGTVLGQLGTNWPFSAEFHSKIAILSHLVPGTGGGSFVGRLAVRKNVYVFCVYCFFFFCAPQFMVTNAQSAV